MVRVTIFLLIAWIASFVIAGTEELAVDAVFARNRSKLRRRLVDRLRHWGGTIGRESGDRRDASIDEVHIHLGRRRRCRMR